MTNTLYDALIAPHADNQATFLTCDDGSEISYAAFVGRVAQLTHVLTNAGVKPGVPYEQQKDDDKLWIRDEFLNAQEKEDLFIVHGHTPVDLPYRDHRRVNVDTGAYFTGKLAAVKIYKDQMSFLTNESKGDTST